MCATILYHNKLQQMCLTKGSSMTELQELRRYRRDLHRIPELDFDLPQTIAYIEGVLAPLACEVTHPCPSCVCAFFDAGVDAAQYEPPLAGRALEVEFAILELASFGQALAEGIEAVGLGLQFAQTRGQGVDFLL